MAKNVVPVKSTAPVADEATKASIDVIRSAEAFASALTHAQRASELSKQLDAIGKLLDRARIDIRDWKFNSTGHLNAVPGGIGDALATWYEEIRLSLEFDFLAIGDVLQDKLSAEKDDGRVPY